MKFKIVCSLLKKKKERNSRISSTSAFPTICFLCLCCTLPMTDVPFPSPDSKVWYLAHLRRWSCNNSLQSARVRTASEGRRYALAWHQVKAISKDIRCISTEDHNFPWSQLECSRAPTNTRSGNTLFQPGPESPPQVTSRIRWNKQSSAFSELSSTFSSFFRCIIIQM